MVNEQVPSAQSTNKIKQLREKFKSLENKFEQVEKKLYEKKKRILEKEDNLLEEHPGLIHPISTIRREGKQVVRKGGGFKERVNPPSEGPWFIITKYRKDGVWELQGTYYTEWERDNAINTIKTNIRNRRGQYSEYYVTENLQEVHRFLKVSKYREAKHQAELRKEISRLPTGKWTENIQKGIQVEEPKQIQRTIEEYSGYEIPRKQTIPRMAVPMWGSTTQRKETLPVFGGTPTRTRQPVKRVIPHDEYKTLLDSGYTREDLESQGIFDKFSSHFQEESVFGKGVVPYRPVSYYQVTLPKQNFLKTPYQKRMEENRPYEFFKPDIVGAIDPITGERKTTYRWRTIKW
jgi:hypothetical protein